jgi:hypothetical protein
MALGDDGIWTGVQYGQSVWRQFTSFFKPRKRPFYRSAVTTSTYVIAAIASVGYRAASGR